MWKTVQRVLLLITLSVALGSHARASDQKNFIVSDPDAITPVYARRDCLVLGFTTYPDDTDRWVRERHSRRVVQAYWAAKEASGLPMEILQFDQYGRPTFFLFFRDNCPDKMHMAETLTEHVRRLMPGTTLTLSRAVVDPDHYDLRTCGLWWKDCDRSRYKKILLPKEGYFKPTDTIKSTEYWIDRFRSKMKPRFSRSDCLLRLEIEYRGPIFVNWVGLLFYEMGRYLEAHESAAAAANMRYAYGQKWVTFQLSESCDRKFEIGDAMAKTITADYPFLRITVPRIHLKPGPSTMDASGPYWTDGTR